MDHRAGTFPAGRLAGIELRVHYSLPLLLAVLFFVYGPEIGSIAIPVIVLSVVLHELGHALVSRRFGREPQGIVLWPLGGLTVGASCPGWPLGDAMVYAAGPVVNVLLAAGASVFLVIPSGDLVTRIAWVTFVINAMLVVINLVPAFPLDGGGILRGLLWHVWRDKHRATLACLRIARVVLILGGVACIALGEIFLAMMAALFLWQGWEMEKRLRAGEPIEEESPLVYGHDFSQGATSLERGEPDSRPGWFARRREERAAEAEARTAASQAELRARVDALLDTVSRHGMDGLTAAERRFLEDASRKLAKG